MQTDQTPGNDQPSGQTKPVVETAAESCGPKVKGGRADGGTPSRPPKVRIVVEINFDDDER